MDTKITQLEFIKLDPDAVLPTRGSEFSAGLDLYSSEDAVIPARGFVGVKTGLAVAVPHGFYARVAPRSGLAVKNGIDTLAGVVDSDYRGELICVLANHSDQNFEIKKGDRIAQLVIEAIITPEPIFAKQLPETTRGENGFGSTGK